MYGVERFRMYLERILLHLDGLRGIRKDQDMAGPAPLQKADIRVRPGRDPLTQYHARQLYTHKHTHTHN